MIEPTDENIDALTEEEILTLHARLLQVTTRRRKTQRVKPRSEVRATDLPPAFAPHLSEDDSAKQANLFRALADHTRLRILDVLNRHGGDVCVFELVACFPLEQPTISHHLRILRDAGLVDCRKRGLYAYYQVRREGLYCACNAIKQFTDATNK